MINFEKYIKESLHEFDFLIVPGLGAFIASFSQASMTDEGKLIEPFKTFTFNGLLNKDEDQKFLNFIKQKEHIGLSEIDSQLKDFIFSLKSSLESNTKIVIADLISLSSANDKLVGDIDSTYNFYHQASQYESVAPNYDSIEIKEEEDEENEDASTLKENQIAFVPIIEEKHISGNEDSPSYESNENLEEAPHEEVEVEYYEEETKAPWLRYLIYILPLLLIFIGLYYVVLHKPFQKKENTISIADNENLNIVDTLAVVDSMSFTENGFDSQLDNLKENNIPESENQAAQTVKSSEERKYPYEVAAGIFRSKKNAENLMEKMKSAGFNAEIRQVSNMRRVYVGVTTVEEALEMSKKIEEFTGLKSVYFDENGVSNR